MVEPGIPHHTPPAAGYPWQVPPPPARRNGLLVAAIVALILALAAMTVALLAWNHHDRSPGTGTPVAPANAAPGNTAPPTSSHETDRALCTAIAPLMTENNHITKTYTELGNPGTPAYDAATPQFITDTQNSMTRLQPALDQHPDANAYLRRSTQRFIDDRNLLTSNLRPGRLTDWEAELWDDSLGAYGGMNHACRALGITW
jgi:hypothetical protein